MKNLLMLIMPVALLVACGGGGGSKTAVIVPQPPPVVVGTAVTSCGQLTQANTTYTLQNDVTSDGTCFMITAQNVVFDLNGHTITYDNLAPVTVPNGGFESDLAGTWNLTSAPNATRVAGTYVQPVTLYSGGYALRFSLPFTGAQYVRSSQVTLAANTTYNISAMFRNSGNNDLAINTYAGGVRDPITMKIELEGTSGSATKTGVTWRGFQHTSFNYTTGASPETHIIRVTVDNVPTGATGYVYVDDVKILRKSSYGIQVGPSYSNAKYATIKNGSIVQGQGGGFASHAIQLEESSGTGYTVDNLTLTVNGPNSRALLSYYANGATIKNNTVNHNTTTIVSRDNYDGAAFYLPYISTTGSALVYGNTFNTGIQTAIYLKSSSSGQHKIYGNNITLQSKYTNDFAIVAADSEVYSNTVNCGSGNNACRGIWAGGTGTIVRNNTITVQQLARNQEYNGCEINGAYGIQHETSNDVLIYGNTVTANAEQCDASAYRANPSGTAGASANISVYANTFTANKTGADVHASSILIDWLEAGVVNFHDNTMVTNDRWVGGGSGGAILSTNTCTWSLAGTLTSPFRPFYAYTWNSGYVALTTTANTYGAGAESYFTSGVFLDGSGNVASGSSITINP